LSVPNAVYLAPQVVERVYTGKKEEKPCEGILSTHPAVAPPLRDVQLEIRQLCPFTWYHAITSLRHKQVARRQYQPTHPALGC
jgi:hypothetical protein